MPPKAPPSKKAAEVSESPVIEPNTDHDVTPVAKKPPLKKPVPGTGPDGKGTSTNNMTVSDPESPVKKGTIPETDTGSVHIEKSVTKNLGDYNSVKVTVGITLPIDHTPEHLTSVKKTIEVINSILDAEIGDQVAQIDDAKSKPKGK